MTDQHEAEPPAEPSAEPYVATDATTTVEDPGAPVPGETRGRQPLTGHAIIGRFQLCDLIRDSKKTALYRGDDLHLPQSVVVKILSPDLSAYPGTFGAAQS